MRPVGAGCSSLPARRAVAQHMGGGSFFGGSEAFTVLRESRQVATFTAIRPYPVSHFYRFTHGFTANPQYFKARESSQVKSGKRGKGGEGGGGGEGDGGGGEGGGCEGGGSEGGCGGGEGGGGGGGGESEGGGGGEGGGGEG